VRKIITVFQRNYETDRLVRDELVPGAEWVLAGEGIATRKWDGACTMVRCGQLFKRYELKRENRPKIAPPGFEPMQAPDEVTGAIPGWVPVGEGPEDKWFRVARANVLNAGDGHEGSLEDGTYEAIGPHFGGGHHDKNPEGCPFDMLLPHGKEIVTNFPHSFGRMRQYFLDMGRDFAAYDATQDSPVIALLGGPSIEGVVFHHPDGRMAKIKARDFGIKRPSSLLAFYLPVQR